MRVRAVLVAGLLLLAAAAADSDAAPQKVLRYAFLIAETSFDPAKTNDVYSRTITSHSAGRCSGRRKR